MFNPKERGAIFEKLKAKMQSQPGAAASMGGSPLKLAHVPGIHPPKAPPHLPPLVPPPQKPVQKLSPVDPNAFGATGVPMAGNEPTNYVGNGKQEHFKRIKRILGV